MSLEKLLYTSVPGVKLIVKSSLNYSEKFWCATNALHTIIEV